jgi:hypothetical protein
MRTTRGTPFVITPYRYQEIGLENFGFQEVTGWAGMDSRPFVPFGRSTLGDKAIPID